MYDSLVVHFMTGTGNSYRVAAWCAEIAAERGLSSELFQIKEGEKGIQSQASSLNVFVFPTHGFTAPWLMLKYVWRLPKSEKKHAIVLPTRAGVRVRGVFIPGLEGTGGYLIALLLWARGYSTQGVMGVDMPSNWTALHWGLSEENSGVIQKLAQPKVRAMLNIVLDGRQHYDGMVQLCLGILLAQISLMYLIMAQLFLSKLFFASDRCNGCGLCLSICPKNALRMLWNRPYWTYGCDSCMACMNFCPRQAIEVSPLFITLFSYMALVPVFAYFIMFTADYFMINIETIPLIGFGIQYLYIIIAIAVAYWVLHFTLGSRLVRMMAGTLSHTRYYRRYRSAGVTLTDIHRNK
jgi:Pyruvate/2-oxoacid:ferredoxin oxidoreductase delta subunit